MERWQQVEEIFHHALERDSSERDAYVRQACHGDAELHREVVSLLANHREGGNSKPWAAEAAEQAIDLRASLRPGQSLGPYRIESFLAAGGMGEVYRATDTRLKREVAIKVSAAQFSERFAREANVIASLNHPHICHLYDVGPNYLVMELVEGTPLRGPLPLKQALAYAGQILDALDVAHRKGIIHRDLKPANILVTNQGVKLLDFGLAKRSGPLQASNATLTAALTGKGQIVGTLQYMAPEQLQGNDADARSDLFSFGCVLHEMLTGKRAFEGESAASVIAAILERDPAPTDTAPPLERVIRTCLAKDPDNRFQNALDLKRNLNWAVEQPIAGSPGRRKWIPAAVAMIVLAAAGGWTLSRLRQPPADDAVVRFDIGPPEGRVVGGGLFGGGFAVSPDSQTAAFIGVAKGKAGLWVRPLNATAARLMPGTEGAIEPFWSPDNNFIAFYARGQLLKIRLSGEVPLKICDIAGAFYGGSWSSDGRILFVIRDVGIFQVPASGGSASQLIALDRTRGEINHESPQVIPGGRFLYTAQGLDGQTIYAASLAKPTERVRVLNVGRGEANTPGTGAWFASDSDGKDYLFFISGWTCFAQPFEPRKAQLTGEPRSLADHAGMARASARVLLYSSFVPLRQFKWFDRKGGEIGLLGEPNPYVFARISRDGRWAATIRAGSNPDIWLLETARGIASRLTSGRGFHISPVWSPDGRTIAFSGGTPFNVFRIPLDGSDIEERVTESPNRQTVTDWSNDGRFLMYAEAAPDTGYDLWFLRVTPEGRPMAGEKPVAYLRGPFDQMWGRFSPDGHWVAYQSDESGAFEVYLRKFPEPGEKIRVSTGGGGLPEWGPGGRELFYVSRDAKLMSAALKLRTDSVEVSFPHELFALSASSPGNSGIAVYTVTPDGQRFLINDRLESTEPLHVVVNWPSLLRKEAGTQ